MKVIEGKLIADNIRIGIVASRFNEFIVKRLLNGAVDGLVRHGVLDGNITTAWVPSAFEIPLMAEKMALSGNYDAVICIGAVIRGSTSAYEIVCAEVSKGIAQVTFESKIPVIFGVLTTESIEQAIENAGSKSGNKGYNAALSAIEMVNAIRQINSSIFGAASSLPPS